MQVLLSEEQDLLASESSCLAVLVVGEPGTHTSSSDYTEAVGLATGVQCEPRKDPRHNVEVFYTEQCSQFARD